MITLDDVRALASALPEVTEQPHFGMPAFRVRDKLFVAVSEDGTRGQLHLGESHVRSAIAADPAAFRELRRGDLLLGLEVDLTTVADEHFGPLVVLAWRDSAPRRLVAAYDEER
jgi:hypothetical protein